MTGGSFCCKVVFSMENSSIAIRPRRLRRRLIWILGFLVVAAIVSGAIKFPTGPAQGTGLAGPSVPPPVGDTFRIGTFNIDGGMGTDGVTDLDRTARCLQHLDFIGLNEVH